MLPLVTRYMRHHRHRRAANLGTVLESTDITGDARRDRRPRRVSTPDTHRLWIASCLPAVVVVVAVWSVLVSTSASSEAASSQVVSANSSSLASTSTSTAPAAPTSTAALATVTNADSNIVDSPALAMFVAQSVEVVGDSLAASAADELRLAFDPATVSVDAETGRPLRIAGVALRAAAATRPDVIVVALGTNDWDGPADYAEQLDQAAEYIAGPSCVVWVNVQQFRPGLASVNAEIDAAANRHGWVIANWSALAGPDDLHTTDGYHLSQAGQTLFADLIAATTATGCS